MSTDQELFAEVRAALHEEVADVTAGPELLAGVRRKHGRRAVTRRLVLVAPVAAAVAAALVLAPQPKRDPDPLDPANAGYVRDRTDAALYASRNDVVYERAVVTEGDKYSEPGEDAVYERWLAADGSRFRLRVTIDGQPVVDLSRDSDVDVFVDYRSRTYRASPGTAPGEQDDVLAAKEVRQAVEHGEITVVGQEEINGKPAVELHVKARNADVPMDLWVDAITYLPVRWQRRQAGSAPFDVTWLPPTPENLALLRTVIPPEFAVGN